MKKLCYCILIGIMISTLASCETRPIPPAATVPPTPTENVNPTATPSPTVSPSPTAISNSLMDAEFIKESVTNGVKSDAIGQCGYIKIKKERLRSVSNKELADFVDQRVKGSGLNWVSIICEDGTGLCFTGSNPSMASYGEVDPQGAVEKSFGFILRGSDGAYTYKEK